MAGRRPVRHPEAARAVGPVAGLASRADGPCRARRVRDRRGHARWRRRSGARRPPAGTAAGRPSPEAAAGHPGTSLPGARTGGPVRPASRSAGSDAGRHRVARPGRRPGGFGWACPGRERPAAGKPRVRQADRPREAARAGQAPCRVAVAGHRDPDLGRRVPCHPRGGRRDGRAAARSGRPAPRGRPARALAPHRVACEARRRAALPAAGGAAGRLRRAAGEARGRGRTAHRGPAHGQAVRHGVQAPAHRVAGRAGDGPVPSRERRASRAAGPGARRAATVPGVGRARPAAPGAVREPRGARAAVRHVPRAEGAGPRTAPSVPAVRPVRVPVREGRPAAAVPGEAGAGPRGKAARAGEAAPRPGPAARVAARARGPVPAGDGPGAVLRAAAGEPRAARGERAVEVQPVAVRQEAGRRARGAVPRAAPRVRRPGRGRVPRGWRSRTAGSRRGVRGAGAASGPFVGAWGAMAS